MRTGKENNLGILYYDFSTDEGPCCGPFSSFNSSISFLFQKEVSHKLLQDIPLDQIDDNPFNSRMQYEQRQIKQLATSFANLGQLSPVKVRKVDERYQLVYGHRRLRAARLLKWPTVRAEVNNYSDQEMLEISVSENLSRSDLSDYEKGISFARMNNEFKMTHEEIASLVGISRTHVSNFIRMTQLFDSERISADPTLRTCLQSLSEHHARVLSTIEESEARAAAVRITVSEQLSVRELQKLIQRLRSWFATVDKVSSGEVTKAGLQTEASVPNEHWNDYEQIQESLIAGFELPKKNDFDSWADLHDYGHGFSKYADSPPFERLDEDSAIMNEKEWFYTIAPLFHASMKDIRVQFFEQVALATFYVNYKSKFEKNRSMNVRCSIVYVKDSGSWKIIHEHWSKPESNEFGRSLKKENVARATFGSLLSEDRH